MTAHRLFARSFDSLPEIFAFTAEVFAREGIDHRLLAVVELAIEELFTNAVKYGADSAAGVRVEMSAISHGVEVTLTDYGVDRFDITTVPEAEVDLPIEQRRPGGLGLHLVRRLVDSIEYEYEEAARQGRITFRKTSTSEKATRGR